MIPKYTTQGAVQKALLNRIIIVDDMTSSVKGQTRQIIGIDLFLEFAEEVELGFIDVFLGMLYVMPLKKSHPYLNAISRDLIVSKIYQHVMPLRSEDPSFNDNFGVYIEKNALARFNCLFLGTGIVIPNLLQETPNLNDENRIKQPQKPLILPGEQLKDYIGYDTDGDGVSDTNLFKKDPIRVDAFYHQGDYNQVNANSAFIEAGVQTRRFRGLPSDKDINEIITQF